MDSTRSNEKLRVLHCIYDDPQNPWVAGGGAVRVYELYRRLRDSVQATVVTGNFPGALDVVMENVAYRRLGAPGPYAWSRLTYAWAATRLLAGGAYDVAVFDFSVYTPLRLPRDRPVGITVHHVTSPTARQRWGPVVGAVIAATERRMLRQARWISVTSHATYEQLRGRVAPGAELIPVAAGVPDDLFELTRDEGEYILYFGRLDWFQKGLDTLLEAFAELRRRKPSLQLRVAGRGKDADRVREYATQLGISDNLSMLGAVTEQERRALFAGARVLLMPSRFEGFGMVAAEAMAAGVPLVAAAAGSLPEVVDAPRGGVLVPPGEPSALAAAVERLLERADERVALSRTARASAERFRWSRVAKDHLDFLHRIRAGASSLPQTR